MAGLLCGAGTGTASGRRSGTGWRGGGGSGGSSTSNSGSSGSRSSANSSILPRQILMRQRAGIQPLSKKSKSSRESFRKAQRSGSAFEERVCRIERRSEERRGRGEEVAVEVEVLGHGTDVDGDDRCVEIPKWDGLVNGTELGITWGAAHGEGEEKRT